MAGLGNIAYAFASREYRIYAAGNAVSLIGTWMQRIAVGWLAWRLTRSGAWLGIVSFAELFPTVVLSPWAGALADRHRRLRVVWTTQLVAMAQASLLAGLTALGLLGIGGLVGLTALLGAANAFNQPARLAFIPSLVDRASLASAVAINSVIANLARFVGPAIAGFVIAGGGTSVAFALNAASYLAFLVALACLRGVCEDAPRQARRPLLHAMLDGYRYAAGHAGIGELLLLMAVTSLGARGFIRMLPGFADTVFGRGPQALAWMVATVGLGAICGGIWMVRRHGVAGLTAIVFANTLLMAGALLAFTATARFWVALPCLWVAGFAFVASGIAAQTLVQSAVDAQLRGRVMALYGMIFRAGPAFGALLTGILSAQLGLRLPVAVGALLCVLYWLWARPRQTTMARDLEVRPGSAA